MAQIFNDIMITSWPQYNHANPPS